MTIDPYARARARRAAQSTALSVSDGPRGDIEVANEGREWRLTGQGLDRISATIGAGGTTLEIDGGTSTASGTPSLAIDGGSA